MDLTGRAAAPPLHPAAEGEGERKGGNTFFPRVIYGLGVCGKHVPLFSCQQITYQYTIFHMYLHFI